MRYYTFWIKRPNCDDAELITDVALFRSKPNAFRKAKSLLKNRVKTKRGETLLVRKISDKDPSICIEWELGNKKDTK